jgi:hypothetical protein
VFDSRLHDNTWFRDDASIGARSTHDDSSQIQISTNIVIPRNKISGADNAGIMIIKDRGPVSNVEVSDT